MRRRPLAGLRPGAAPGDVVELAGEHGALVHGFTPVWYSKHRLATIAAAIGPSRD